MEATTYETQKDVDTSSNSADTRATARQLQQLQSYGGGGVLHQRRGDTNETHYTAVEDHMLPETKQRQLDFGGGLLPNSAHADTRRGMFQVSICKTETAAVECGVLYMSIGSENLSASCSLGLDMDPRGMYRELVNPLFYRALLAECLGTFVLLYFTLTCAVYREQYVAEDLNKVISAIGDSRTAGLIQAAMLPSVSAAANGAAQISISLVFGLTVFLMVYLLAPVSGGHFNPAVTIGKPGHL